MFLLFLLPIVTANNLKVCSDFGFNWAAEIRCLRTLLQQCQDHSTTLSRGARTVDSKAPFRFSYHGAKNNHYKDSYSGKPEKEIDTDPDIFMKNVTEMVEKRVALVKHQLERDFHRKLADLKNWMEEELKKKPGVINQVMESSDDLVSSVRKNEADIRKLTKRVDLLSARIHRHGHHEYIFVNERENWYHAEEICVEWGGHLASVLSPEDNRYLLHIMGSESAWISLNDVQKENIYVNTDRSVSSFKNWAHNQPDNANHNENCVELGKDGKWSDLFCFMRRPFFCKR